MLLDNKALGPVFCEEQAVIVVISLVKTVGERAIKTVSRGSCRRAGEDAATDVGMDFRQPPDVKTTAELEIGSTSPFQVC
ncbi:hypothetical protein GCM10010301_73470 [Streptomyces plicatus]|nr:hypothetical protein GCM10010301_73470 [Streptomyces plicatus]